MPKRYFTIELGEGIQVHAHKDILDPTGSVVRKVWFELLDNQQGLDLAIKDLKDNYLLYIERFEKWKN